MNAYAIAGLTAAALKAQVIAEIIRVEGGYSDNRHDSGGETMYGVTVAVARAYGYTGPMRDLPRDVAERIYAARYWDALRLDDVAALSVELAAELADTGVNCGVGRAAEFLQVSLNVLNRREKLYPDLKVDKDLGNMTLHALTRYFSARPGRDGVKVLMRALNGLQAAFYIELAGRREKDEEFVYGWLLNRVA